MKTSNIFILIALVAVAGFSLRSTLFGQYVSQQEYKQNRKESIESLETPTYGYKTDVFDQPFDRILIKNTQTNNQVYQANDLAKSNSRHNEIRWIKSESCGVKTPKYNDFIQRSAIENHTLVIYTDHSNRFALDTIHVYSPSLSHIAIENTGGVRLTNTVADSLSVTATRSHFEIGGTSAFEKLDIQAGDQSAVRVEARHVGEARYTLSASSAVRSEIDSCSALYIQGDSDSHAVIAPYSEKGYSARNTLHYLSFNSELTDVRIENTRIHQIDGNKANLSLSMNAQQIEETLAVITGN